jgi:hypothetical protein
MKKRERKWCVCQQNCTDLEGWVCMAHLAEGWIPECPYKESDIDPGIRRPVKKNMPQGGGDGVCQDYQSYVEKVTRRLRGA